MLLLTWLTAPWRATARVLAGLASALAGCHPRQGVSVVVLAGVVVAEFRALQHGHWMAAGVLVVVGLTVVLVPLANAAISRRSEYAADRFAAHHGLAVELAAALRVLDAGKRAPSGWSRLLSTHPTAEQRIRALRAATVGQRPDGDFDRHANVDIAEAAERLLRAGVSSRELEH